VDNVIELEYDSETNGSYHFRPAMKSIRGRFDVNRTTDAGVLRKRFPRAIPGQRLGFNFATGECYIREPLHDAENAAIRKEVEKTWAVEDEKQTFPVDAATFVYWTKEAMKAGKLRVAAGQYPKQVAGEPQKHFRFAQEESEISQLKNEFRRLGDLLEKALARK
jgi:hypothetical protein